MDSANQDPNSSKRADQSNNNDAQSRPPEKASGEKADIFSLDAIDDSWMDEKAEEFPQTRVKDVDPKKLNQALPKRESQQPMQNTPQIQPQPDPVLPSQAPSPIPTHTQPQPQPQAKPMQNIPQAQMDNSEVGKTATLNRKSRDSYHFFVDGSNHLELHGEYKTLRVLETNEAAQDNVSVATEDKPETPINPNVEATLMEIDQSQQFQAPHQVRLPEELAPSSQPRPGIPKVEDLLSGSFEPVDSTDSEKLEVPDKNSRPPNLFEDTSPTISEMIKRDLQLDSLIDKGQIDVGGDEKTKVQEIFSQPQQMSEPQVNVPQSNDSLPPPAPSSPPVITPAPPQPRPTQTEALQTPLQKPQPPSTSLPSQNKPISRKDFSRYGSKRPRPFLFIVLGVVLVGVIIGVGLYQFKDAFNPKSPDNKGETSPTPEIASSISATESGAETEDETTKQRKENWERDFDKGLKSFNNKDYQKAVVYFSTSIAEDGGKHSKVIHMRGRSYSKLKKYKKAIDDFTAALKLDSRNENILIDRAAAYIYNEDSKHALKDYSRIISRNPDNLKAIYGRALVYYQLDRIARAKRDFEKVLSIDSNYVSAYYYLGMIHHSNDENKEAISCFDKALVLEKRAELYYERAFVNYAENNTDDALDDLTNAIELKPDRKEYYNDRGFIYLKENRLDKAKADFEKALKLDPDYKIARDNLNKASKGN